MKTHPGRQAFESFEGLSNRWLDMAEQAVTVAEVDASCRNSKVAEANTYIRCAGELLTLPYDIQSKCHELYFGQRNECRRQLERLEVAAQQWLRTAETLRLKSSRKLAKERLVSSLAEANTLMRCSSELFDLYRRMDLVAALEYLVNPLPPKRPSHQDV